MKLLTHNPKNHENIQQLVKIKNDSGNFLLDKNNIKEINLNLNKNLIKIIYSFLNHP